MLLQLHWDYTLSELINQKIEQQFVESFKMIEYIEQLTYYLDLLFNWKIYNIISIAYLESAHTHNLYIQSWSDYLSAVTVNNETDHYKIDWLLWKKITKCDCNYITEYLVRWKEYESEHNIWYNVKNLSHTHKLVKKYNHITDQTQITVLL